MGISLPLGKMPVLMPKSVWLDQAMKGSLVYPHAASGFLNVAIDLPPIGLSL